MDMWLVAGVVMGLYVLLLFMARREMVHGNGTGVLKPFYGMALYLYKRICAKRLPLTGRGQVAKDLEGLHPGENREVLCTEYYVKKLAVSLVICLLGTVFGLLIHIKTEAEVQLNEDGGIERGSYLEGDRELEVTALLPSGEETFRLQIGARQLTEEEINSLYEEFIQSLPELVRGENESLQQVSETLVLEESYEAYPFCVEWKSERPDVVSALGAVHALAKGATEVLLEAEISYGERVWREELPICVTAPPCTGQEQLRAELEGLLITEEEKSRADGVWMLPSDFQGIPLHWKQKVRNQSFVIWGGVLAISVLIFFMADKDLHDELQRKRKRMKRAYPDVLHKLVLYLGAGLTVRGALQRMAGEYEEGKEHRKKILPIYEEILFTCREIQTGVSEAVAYEHFGKRTGIQEYMRLSTLLMQNIKKGNSTLLQRLKEEADRAYIEQLQNGRRLGEEASTKLLLPMVMLLLVVMLMIMLPAFSSVGF